MYERQERRKSGDEDESFIGKIKLSCKRQDGDIEFRSKEPTHLLKIVHAILSVEYEIKCISQWIRHAQFGLGFSFSVKPEFFSGELALEWAYREHTDDRVFLYWKAEANLVLAKLEIELEMGFKAAGMADLVAVLGGKGEVSLAFEAEKKHPDENPEKKISPKGEISISGSVKTQLFWVVKGGVGLETKFVVKCDMEFFPEGGAAVEGKVEFSRDKIVNTITFSCLTFGGTRAIVISDEVKYGTIPFCYPFEDEEK